MVTAEELRARLSRPRDVRPVWSRFAPELAYGRHRFPPPFDVRHAAVLVLMYLDEGVWRVPLIERPPSLSIHASQICFPGGGAEPGELPEQTALREFEEELGVAPADFQLCGQLRSAYIYASNYYVTPVVALASRRPAFVPNPCEVANLLEPPLVHLANPEHVGSHEVYRAGLRFQAPHIEFGGHRIWGATSMMLAELFDVLRDG